MELWRYAANGVGTAKQLFKGASVLRKRAFPSPDGKWVVIAQMISELSALHSQVFTQDLRRGAYAIDVGSLAANVEKTPLGFRVIKIFGSNPELLEERSPLARPRVNVKLNETITGVNGISAAAPRLSQLGELLRNQNNRQVLLSIQDTRGESRDVIVTPIDPRRDRELRYLTWERKRSNFVNRASTNRIGYVHLQAMGPADIARWAREFYPVFQRKGLILDLRYNRGGSIDSWVIEKLQRRAWHFWQTRNSDQALSNQQLAFRGHVVALIDADTYSDGETMAQGLRRLAIAPLIGMTTAGAGVWLSDQNRLIDNGLAQANWVRLWTTATSVSGSPRALASRWITCRSRPSMGATHSSTPRSAIYSAKWQKSRCKSRRRPRFHQWPSKQFMVGGVRGYGGTGAQTHADAVTKPLHLSRPPQPLSASQTGVPR